MTKPDLRTFHLNGRENRRNDFYAICQFYQSSSYRAYKIFTNLIQPTGMNNFFNDRKTYVRFCGD